MNIEEFIIKNDNEETLMGLKIDTMLSFQNHASSLNKKASQKSHAFSKILPYMNLNKRKCLMKAFL